MSCCGKKEEPVERFDDSDAKATHETVTKYYSETVQKTSDLATAACCVNATNSVPPAHRAILSKIHDEIMTTFYGCGSTLPPQLEGATVLDLGCGTGRDVYLASGLVGATGKAIGIDMTAAQLEVARRHVAYHADALGTPADVCSFFEGRIEDIRGAGVPDGTVDVVVSNCVVNLAPDKGAVLSAVAAALKEGGELHFSDVYASRRVPREMRGDVELWGECLAGAMYWADFKEEARKAGLVGVRKVSTTAVPIGNNDVEQRCAKYGVDFSSITVRAFRPPKPQEGWPEIEPTEEDYGQDATLLEQVDGSNELNFGDGLVLTVGTPVKVSSNEAVLLVGSRYGQVVKVTAWNADAHRGPFVRGNEQEPECEPKAASTAAGGCGGGKCC